MKAASAAIVLVEGPSDRAAMETLARRRGCSLETVAVLAMGGATNIGRYLDRYGPGGANLTIAGLCDAAEEADFHRAMERAGLGADLTRAAAAELGFFVCDADLEDELIRALGAPAVEAVIVAEGELGPYRTFSRQPAQRERPVEARLRRFLGTRSGRKTRYAAALVAALDLAAVPRPLDGVLAHLGLYVP